jgi:hypothetical protein
LLRWWIINCWTNWDKACLILVFGSLNVEGGMRPVSEQGLRRSWMNQELRCLCEVTLLAAETKRCRPEWLKRAIRMRQIWDARRIFEVNPKGNIEMEKFQTIMTGWCREYFTAQENKTTNKHQIIGKTVNSVMKVAKALTRPNGLVRGTLSIVRDSQHQKTQRLKTGSASVLRRGDKDTLLVP